MVSESIFASVVEFAQILVRSFRNIASDNRKHMAAIYIAKRRVCAEVTRAELYFIYFAILAKCSFAMAPVPFVPTVMRFCVCC